MSKKPKQEKLSNAQANALALLGVIFLEKGWTALRKEFLSRWGLDFRSALSFLLVDSRGYENIYSLNPDFEQLAASTALLFRLADPNFGSQVISTAEYYKRREGERF